MELLLATDEQKRQRDPLTHAVWGGRLSVQQYLERELALRAHPWAREAMRTWLLVEGGQVLCSCETFRMVSQARPDTGAPMRGATEGVASVFTEPALRGRGLAGIMMQRLLAWLRSEGAQASILFSDIGQSLYERAGYRSLPPAERRFASDSSLGPGRARLLGEAEAAREVGALAVPADAFLVWPTTLQVDWHHERERLYSRLLSEPRPEACGARLGEGGVVWAGDLKNRRLMVLMVWSAAVEEARELLDVARGVAGRAGLSKVVLWNEPWPFEWPEGFGQFHNRVESIPMIAPLGVAAASRWSRSPRALWI